jgi:hypothetical protein
MFRFILKIILEPAKLSIINIKLNTGRMWTVYSLMMVHFGDLPAAPFLELTKKKANSWEDPAAAG